MPVTIERPTRAVETRVSDIRERRLRRGTIRDRGRRLTIGLVNNMPDSALAATERQFNRVLEAVAGDVDVQLRFYALAQVPRSPETLQHLSREYVNAAALQGDSLDALIITGAQPVAKQLKDEPYWAGLTRVIDWAEANTISAILSCLAAHVGVEHFSGVTRRPLPKKCSGVFAFERIGANPLTEGAASRWIVPHSRYNGVDEAELTQAGYAVLTRSARVGVDMFVKQMRSLLVFLQGHPEYEIDTLAREYRRDLSRFLSGELATSPDIPEGYFSAEAERALELFRSQAPVKGQKAMAAYPDVALRGPTDAAWRASTDLLYRNWLSLVAERKVEAVYKTSSLAARWGG